MAGQWWSRGADGRLRLRLGASEAATILGLINEMREVLDGPADDPIMQRLFPRAYLDPTEDQAETMWRALAGPDLLRDRLDRLDRLTSVLEPVALGDRTEPIAIDADAEADWLCVLNDTRLTLGTAIGVSDDDDDADDPDHRDSDHRDSGDWDADDPQGPARHLYQALTYFQGELVDLLLGAMPESGADDF